MKVSVCIPTWEQYGFGSIFLKQLLDTLDMQDYRNFEVVISDHSVNDDIKKLTKEYSKTLDISYIKNENNRGNSPSNTNNSIKHANGEIVKIMFQDDFFINNKSLSIIVKSFDSNEVMWVVNGCNHTNDGINFYNEMTPSWNDNIIFGQNTISSPSVLSFINQNINFFDENLVMLMDCEYYYKLYLKHGEPKIIDEILVCNRMHQHQISSNYKKNISEEINYIKQKYEW